MATRDQEVSAASGKVPDVPWRIAIPDAEDLGRLPHKHRTNGFVFPSDTRPPIRHRPLDFNPVSRWSPDSSDISDTWVDVDHCARGVDEDARVLNLENGEARVEATDLERADVVSIHSDDLGSCGGVEICPPLSEAALATLQPKLQENMRELHKERLQKFVLQTQTIKMVHPDSPPEALTNDETQNAITQSDNGDENQVKSISISGASMSAQPPMSAAPSHSALSSFESVETNEQVVPVTYWEEKANVHGYQPPASLPDNAYLPKPQLETNHAQVHPKEKTLCSTAAASEKQEINRSGSKMDRFRRTLSVRKGQGTRFVSSVLSGLGQHVKAKDGQEKTMSPQTSDRAQHGDNTRVIRSPKTIVHSFSGSLNPLTRKTSWNKNMTFRGKVENYM
ncbi:MAG: hypothetical protein M1833_002741 [Piccolia ochrophora]|nr:MAG: hypothetical protein M1833_002741 [Piccolia ochrophora]